MSKVITQRPLVCFALIFPPPLCTCCFVGMVLTFTECSVEVSFTFTRYAPWRDSSLYGQVYSSPSFVGSEVSKKKTTLDSASQYLPSRILSRVNPEVKFFRSSSLRADSLAGPTSPVSKA